MRIVLDYRPALRHRTGVGEFAHQMAVALARQAGAPDAITLFSSSWKDRLTPGAVPGARTIDARLPVALLNYAWHRLEWPPIEQLAGPTDVAWSMHPLLMPARRAAQVVTIHDLYFLDRPEETAREVRRDYAALAAAHATRADGVIVVSEYTREQVAVRLGVPKDRMTVCSPGAPAWDARPEPASAGPILHVGTIEPRKNVAALLAAYAHLVRGRGDAPPLVLAGRIEPSLAAVREEDAHALGDRVQWRGYVSDEERRRLYGEASMLVMASHDEGFGMPALEAMTVGVPVVVSARGSLPEVVGDAGLTVDAGDPEAFAAAMSRVLDEPVLRRELAAHGVERSRRFTWEASAARARTALAAAAARREGRRR